MKAVRLMNSPAGRVVRAVVGLALIGAGIATGGAGGAVIAVIGLVPLTAGVARVCLFAPIAGIPARTR